ncbi:UvrD-helicase domain-containing protein [Alteriqipengyuania flavescens]|uniref:UvrD-helicase domain-containing protein n=1 Tax=Alteriqipengyuania flavescens TaxID=3053610 RepID=UPI0025B5F675|nr:UvrD-helicase domain-containing protein [Alteriqipengyuania flavescens]WJY19675.1 UvrD-helicase domain-containing protein [Alteriqipengyuania flavescens]WJY25615.1 UvrD-helicase domain-containing protein [Alteriqipengyuania flavescens]
MDAVELARQRAAALHDAAVAGGADPWNPIDIVTAVAADRGLDVEPVDAGSPILAGGRAHFDPSDRAIRHEDTGDAFARAFLIGHELGHATLGDDRAEHTALEVDPARAAEAAPVGEDRIVDYSRRERREIQMDLFGRELILPRARARFLHLGGMTASQIAERLGAPFDVVAMQLLDVLLLPEIEAAPPQPPASPPKPLNPEQAEAARHRGAPYLLEAGPGTGKTQTLVGRVADLVDGGVDPRSILVLTFSNKAAGELSDRIAALRPDAAPAMWIGTFHAFGLDIVRRHHRQLGFSKEPRMMDRSEAIAIMEREYLALNLQHHREFMDPARPLKEMLGAMSRAKDEVADAERFAALAQQMIDNAIDADARKAGERCAEVALVYRRYEELKQAACAVDFGDLVALPVKLLDDDPQTAAALRAIYSHILVDEYQDVNRSSVRLLQKLTDAGRNLWAVGDARQAIYRFRGASSFNMSRFATNDFPGASVGRLRVNYRSTPEIVSAFSRFGESMRAGTGDASLDAFRPSIGIAPEHVPFGDNDDEADALADEIARISPQVPFCDQAVLCPGNDRLTRVGRELERRGIPVLYLGNLFERPEVKDLLSVLSLLVDRRAMGLVRKPTLEGLATGLSLAGASAVVENLRATDAGPMAWASATTRAPHLGQSDADALDRAAEMLVGFGIDARPWTVLAHLLLDRTRTAALLDSADDVSSRAMGVAIWQLMGFLRAERSGPGLPIQRTLDGIRRLVQLADERDLRQLPAAAQGIDAVRLMTIHGSKGLEFPAVHVMGLNKNAMPSTARKPVCPVPDGMIEGGQGGTVALAAADHALEQECLFYVAASRARDRLLLYSATRTAKGARRDASPFIARLGVTNARPAIAHAERAADPETLPLPIRIGPPVRITTTQLDLYSRCPRRFLYTHVLDVGGRRTPTTMSRMHDLVRGVVRELAATDPSASSMAEMEALLELRWSEGPLATEEYRLHREVATLLLRRFVTIRSGEARADAGPLVASIGGDEVTAVADDVVTAGGRHVARVVRTGHRSSSTGKALADAAFQMAAAASLPGCVVEIIHLGDDEPIIALAFDSKALGRNLGKLTETLESIASGRFEPERSDRTCPFCPAFFTCGPLAEGNLQKNF